LSSDIIIAIAIGVTASLNTHVLACQNEIKEVFAGEFVLESFSWIARAK